MYVYAFDVDDTLELSGGPVTLTPLRDLKDQGHIIGLCGNWAVFVQRVEEWHRLLSFVNAGEVPNDQFLCDRQRCIPADDFIMVGNILGVSGHRMISVPRSAPGGAVISAFHFAAGEQ